MDNFLNINYQKNNNDENKNLKSSFENHTKIESYSSLKGLLSGIFDNLKENNKIINVDLKTIKMLKKNIYANKRHSVNVSRNIKLINKKKIKKVTFPFKNNLIKFKNNIKKKSKSLIAITNKLHLNSIIHNSKNNVNNILTHTKSLKYNINNKHLFLKSNQKKKLLEKNNLKKHFNTTLENDNKFNNLKIKKNSSNLLTKKKTQIYSKKIELSEIQNTLRNNLFNYKPNKKFENNSEDDNYISKKKTMKRYSLYINNIYNYRKLERKNKIYDSMSEDENESEEEIENKNKIFIMPNSIIHYFIDFLLILACIYDLFFYTFYLAYYANELELFFCIKFHKIIIIFIDYLYILDFILGFFTAYYDYDEILITKLDKIFYNYFNSFGIFDLILSIPISSILIKSINNNSIKYYSSYNNKKHLIFIITFIKKLKMIKIFSGLRNNILSYILSFHHFTFFGSIYSYSLVFFAILHNVVSLYIFIGKNTFPNWIVYLNLNNNKSEFFKIYIFATYYIISTVTTVGYGDISTYTLTEKIFGVILLLVGIIAYSFAITSVSNYVKKINSKNEEYEKRVEIFHDILKKNPGIDPELTEQIFRNLKYQYNTDKKSYDFNEIYDDLPLGLKNSLIMNMYKPIIENFIFFKGLSNKDFIVKILLSFKPLIAVKNDILIKNGDFMEEIIFIKTGKLSLDVPVDLYSKKKSGNLSGVLCSNKNLIKNYSKEKTIIFDNNCINYVNNYNNDKFKNDDLNERLKKKFLNNEKKITTYIQILILRENEHFGIITIFLNKRSPLRVKVRSKESELLLLKKEDILELASQFPQIWKKINQRSLINYNQVQLLIKKSIEIYNLTNNINQNVPDDYNDLSNSSSSSSSFCSSITKKNNIIDNNNKNKDISNNTNNNNKDIINENKLQKTSTKNSKSKKLKKNNSDSSSSSSHMESYLSNKNLEEKNKLNKNHTNLIDNDDKENTEEKKNELDIKNGNNKIFLSNADKKTFQTLTPFRDSQINDEIYPGEDFMICNKSLSTITNNISKNIIFEENKNDNNNEFNNSDKTKNYNNIIFDLKKNNENNFDIINEESFTLDSSYDNLNELSNYSYSNNKYLQENVKFLINKSKNDDNLKTIKYNVSCSSNSSRSSDKKSNNYSINKPISPKRIKFAKFNKKNKSYSFNGILKKKQAAREIIKKKTNDKISFDSIIFEKKNTSSNENSKKDNFSEKNFNRTKSHTTRRKSKSFKNLQFNNLKDFIDDSSSGDENKKKVIRHSKKDDELLYLVNNNINQNLLINNNQNFGNKYLKTMTKEIISISHKKTLKSDKN